MLLNLIEDQRGDIDKIYLYVKDPFEALYQLLINETEKLGIEKLKNPKVFIDNSEAIDNNVKKKRKVLALFDNTIADMEANKN